MLQAVHRELSQQKSLSRELDVAPLLDKATKMLNCDLIPLQHASIISAQDKDNRTALMIAAAKGRTEVVKLLT